VKKLDLIFKKNPSKNLSSQRGLFLLFLVQTRS
jgi:hypothetical protein